MQKEGTPVWGEPRESQNDDRRPPTQRERDGTDGLNVAIQHKKKVEAGLRAAGNFSLIPPENPQGERGTGQGGESARR